MFANKQKNKTAHRQLFFLVFSFILFLVIFIITGGQLVLSATIISIALNFIIMSTQLDFIGDKLLDKDTASKNVGHKITARFEPTKSVDTNEQLMDADEFNTYQAHLRNDPYRVLTGISQRKNMMDKYLNEELNEEENSQWWGRQET
jgi:hypothetical protein